MERSLNKVYINPNFTQRPFPNHMPFGNQSKSHMHVNPKFPQVHINNNIDHNNVNITKRRIFVNPNFVPPNYTSTSFTTGMNCQNVPLPSHPMVDNSHTSTYSRYKKISSLPTTKEIPQTKVQPSISPSVSKSRYTLVRRNTDVCVKNVDQSVNKNSTTIKINKYKTAQLSYIKDIHRTVEKTKEASREILSSYINRLLPQRELPKTPTIASTNYGRYVRVNKSNPPLRKTAEIKLAITRRTPLNRSSSFRNNRKIIRGKFKKNNIPCPLFTKFGKCLRSVHGNCEFLHDKKHVSLCRKFLKGICHDPSCSFSHETSAKKMSTCYFYLNGMCTKDDCQYLHVKLNNETKICNDFLKGYCEKGEKCEHRHVNKRLQSFIRRNMNIQRQYTCSSPMVVSKTKVKIKQQEIARSKRSETKRKSLSNSKQSSNDATDTECRYFKETNATHDENEACDVIKPSRCKLGTLPSFIKL